MPSDRRGLLRILGTATATVVAGCPSTNGGNGTDAPDEIEAADSTPLAAHTSRPPWAVDGAIGQAVLVDSDDRERAALGRYDLDESRRERIRAFLSDIDYDRERLLLVESAGPNACHDRLELGPFRFDSGRLRADAAVVDTRRGDVACAAVVIFPSALARISFVDTPPDAAAVEVTDGWDETATVHANTDDPIGGAVATGRRIE